MQIFSHFFALFLCCLLISFTNAVYFIQDLQGSNQAALTAELATWTSDTGSVLSSSTSRFVLFSRGSPYTQIQKTYQGIFDHDYIAFSLAMYMESSCTGNILQISFDDIQTQVLVANSLATAATPVFYIKGGVPHSGNSLQVTIERKLPSNCASFRFGLRELNLNFIKNLNTPEQQICHTRSAAPQLTPICGCASTQREESPCTSCSTGCLYCGKTISGIETCSKCDSTKSLEWDGEACSTCGSHCSQCGTKMGNDCRTCLGQYFKYGNGTCIDNCPSPLKKTSLQGYYLGGCSLPCMENEWLYADLSCKDSCPYYFVDETDSNGIRWCKSPCEGNNGYYSEERKTCEDSCEYPNKPGDVGGIKTCSLDLAETLIKSIKTTSRAVNGVNSGSLGAILALSFLSSSDSSSIYMGAFSKMLQYIKYMNIAYPPKVQRMLELLSPNSSSTGSLASNIMRKQLNKFPSRKLPDKFEYYGANSSFFVNYWPSLFTLLILFFITVLTILLSFSCKSSRLLTQVTGILKWNMILLLFCGDFGDLVFFTSLELISAKLNSFESAWSLVVCIMINIFAIWVLVKILSINFKIRKDKRQQIESHEIENKWADYRTFFAIYKDESYFQQIFLFIFLIRIAIFNFVVGYFFNFPLLQAILITLTNLSMLLYLIFKRPLKAMINFIQQIVHEGFLFIFNICICLLAGLDHNKIEAYGFRNGVGEVMFILNIIVPIVSIGTLVAKILILGIEAFREWKADKEIRKKDLEREIRIEVPQRRRRRAEVPGDITVKKMNELEINLANKSNILDVSSSNASFLNNSQSWINIQTNEQGPKSSKTLSRFGTFGQPTNSPLDQESLDLPSEMRLCGMEGRPARKIWKRTKIKRNRSIKNNHDRVKNSEVEVVFGFEGA